MGWSQEFESSATKPWRQTPSLLSLQCNLIVIHPDEFGPFVINMAFDVGRGCPRTTKETIGKFEEVMIVQFLHE